jgi:hypothetical protein
MKSKYLILIIAGLMIVFGFSTKNYPGEKDSTEKPLVLKYSPASNFIEVDLKSGFIEALKHDSSESIINIRIINAQGVNVFSGTKTSYPFTIYIGGLPNGKYIFALKVKQVEVSEKFEVSH